MENAMSWDDDLQDWEVGISGEEPIIESDTFTQASRPEGWEEQLAQSEPDRLLCWLVIREPRNKRGTILAIKPDQIIGRGREAHIRLEDPRMSRVHARFTLEEAGFVIWDAGARNGIYLNGEKLSHSAVLHENDQLQMGETIFVVKLLD
ncbi:MAG: hypothetical protein CUN56_06320 [Phototrophicales bacterium]|nr:MAG: hypothetical protein CUN56_06320 [Phototrophicales bacterium]